jgi:asparagine N-glycosylation enzyme membrane subunit Stt3
MIGVDIFAFFGVLIYLYLVVLAIFSKSKFYAIFVLVLTSVVAYFSAIDAKVFTSAYLGWFFIFSLPIGLISCFIKFLRMRFINHRVKNT